MTADATTAPSARERAAECDRMSAAFREKIEEARERLADLPLRDPARRTLRRQVAEMEADLCDIEAEKARLAPLMQAEREEAMRSARVAQWERAAQAYPHLLRATAEIDRAVAAIFPKVSAVHRQAEAIRSTAGVEVPPWHIAQPLPPLEQVMEVIVAKAMAAAGYLPEELPARFRDELHPGRAVAAATITAEFSRMGEFINAAHPDRQRAERQRAEAEQRERAEREAAALREPLPRLPAPQPKTYGPRRDAA